MNKEDKEQMSEVVELATMRAVAPLITRMGKHETAIAVNQDRLATVKTSQKDQGNRLGDVETAMGSFVTDRKWARVLIGAVFTISLVVLAWYLRSM